MKILKLFFFIILFQLGFILSGYTEIIDYIVATVDKEMITSFELKEKLAPIVEYYNKTYTGEELKNRIMKAREDILNESIEEKILLINAEKSKIEVTEEEVEKNIEEFKKLHPAYGVLTKQNMLEALSAPIHPGAMKYYKEAGLK